MKHHIPFILFLQNIFFVMYRVALAWRLTPLAQLASDSPHGLVSFLPRRAEHLALLEPVFLLETVHCISTTVMLSAPSNHLVKLGFSYPPERSRLFNQ